MAGVSSATALTRPRTLALPRGAGPLAAWAGLVAAGALLGRELYADDPLVRIGNAPLVGSADLRIAPGLAVAVTAAGLLLWRAPVLARSLRWRALLAAAWVGAAAWALVLALSDGAGALTAPLERRYEYLAAVDRVGDPLRFLDGFTGALATYPTHVKGHPPGLLLALAGLDGAGLGGAGVAAALVIGMGALAAPAALVALRSVTHEAAARSAAPFLVAAPAAVWVATSADALFMGVATCGVAAFAVAAATGRPGAAVASGVLLGGGLLLSYGIAPLALVVAALAWQRHAWRATAIAGAAVCGVLVLAGAAGFWWWDGLAATRDLYDAGVASRRPYLAFLVIAPAAFALAIGPAALAGLARLRGRGWWLCGGALAAVVLADVSGLSRGETERIWLPFVPLVLAATASLGASRAWLGAQLALAIALQAGTRSPW